MKLIKVITEGKIHYFEENLRIIKQATYADNQIWNSVSIFVVGWVSAISNAKPPSVRRQYPSPKKKVAKNSEQIYKHPRQNQTNQ